MQVFCFRILAFLIYSNIFIAIAAISLGLATLWQLEGEYKMHLPYLVLLFSGTLCSYTLHRLVALSRFKQALAHYGGVIRWSIDHVNLLYALFFFASLTSVVCFFLLSPTLKILLVVTGLLTIAYSLPLIPSTSLKGQFVKLRDIGFSKIFIIAIVWSLTTGTGIALSMGYTFADYIVYSITFERFLFLIGITLPFDIRDAKYDKAQGVRTIPIRIGVKWSKRLSVICLWLAMLLCFERTNSLLSLILIKLPICLWCLILLTYSALSFTITYIIAAFLAYRTKADKHGFYFTGLLDGTMILPLLLYIIFIVVKNA